MRTTIKATTIELTDAIRAYIEEKITSLDKFIDAQDTTAYADVEVEQTTRHHQSGPIFRAEANVHVAQKMFRVEVTDEDLYAAIDKMKDELIRNISEYKDRKQDLIRRGGLRFKELIQRFTK